LLNDLVGRGYQVVLVDDGSQDGTHDLVRKFPVYSLRHICNLGQGAALQTGISYALSHPDCAYIVTFDADGQHASEHINDLVRALDQGRCDVALGSRFLQGGAARNIPHNKLVVLKMAVWFTRVTTRLEVTDTHNGLRAFTRQAAAGIHITQNKMSHATQLLHQIKDLELSFVEVPVSVRYTEYSLQKGQSIWNAFNILWDSILGGLE
jgi:glycosyltransferase involved in cell wall biosynthesis